MNSSARIKDELDRSQAMDVAMVVPAVATGFETIDTVHAVAGSFSTEAAAEIPLGAQAGLLRKITLSLAPVFLAFGWVAFFKAFKQLWQAPNKNFELWMNAGVSFIAAAGATIGTAFLLGGLAYVAPYLFAAILGLNALQGLYYTAKNLILAYKNREQRWQHLKEAGKQFLGIVTNTLAMVLNIFVFQAAQLIAGGIKEFASSIYSIFMHFEELMRFVNGPVTSAILNIRGVGLAWLGVFTLGLISSAAKINKESWHMIQGTQADEPTFEREALNDLRQIFKVIGDRNEPFAKRFFLALTSPVTVPLYAATAFIYTTLVRPLAMLTVGIPQLIFMGVYHGLKSVFSSANTEPPISSQREVVIQEAPLRRSEKDEGNEAEIDVRVLRSRDLTHVGQHYSPAHFQPANHVSRSVERQSVDLEMEGQDQVRTNSRSCC